jgi:hypothetical protein
MAQRRYASIGEALAGSIDSYLQRPEPKFDRASIGTAFDKWIIGNDRSTGSGPRIKSKSRTWNRMSSVNFRNGIRRERTGGASCTALQDFDSTDTSEG